MDYLFFLLYSIDLRLSYVFLCFCDFNVFYCFFYLELCLTLFGIGRLSIDNQYILQ